MSILSMETQVAEKRVSRIPLPLKLLFRDPMAGTGYVRVGDRIAYEPDLKTNSEVRLSEIAFSQ